MNAKTVKLAAGSHAPGEGQACVMEVVSMLAGEPFSDHPKCACPALTTFAIATNDWMTDDERHLLWPFTTRLAGSKADEETERKRAYRMADWAVREVAPLALEAAGRADDADRLRNLSPVIDWAAADADAYADAVTAAAYAVNTAAYAAAATAAATAAYAAKAAKVARAAKVERNRLLEMRLALLDELCPPAPMPDEAVAEQIARELEAA